MSVPEFCLVWYDIMIVGVSSQLTMQGLFLQCKYNIDLHTQLVHAQSAVYAASH